MSRVREHNLKTWPEPFTAVWEGHKVHEVRNDDRAFAAGDVLILEEYDPSPSRGNSTPRGLTGRAILATVTHKTPGGSFGLPVGVCVLSITVNGKEEHARHGKVK